MKLEWSAAALADLDRFARFLQDHYPHLAGVIAAEIISKA
jgi:plasmid stabilization system protein ParE